MALTKVVEGEPLRFMLINKTPGSDCKFVIQAPSDAVKHTWTLQITSLLDMQGDFLRGNHIWIKKKWLSNSEIANHNVRIIRGNLQFL